MDTHLNSLDPASSLFVSPQELCRLLHSASAPLLLDVRPQGRYDASERMLAGAPRCTFDEVSAIAALLYASNPRHAVVTYCVYGHHVGVDAAKVLHVARLNADALAGGFEGGVDNAQDIAQWRSAELPTVAKSKP